MNNETFYRMETVYEACKNLEHQQIVIPLIKHIRFVDGEMYATVLDFCNRIGGEIDNSIKMSIFKRINKEN